MNVVFQEFAELEKLYGIKFPVEFKNFYLKGFPTSSGFYNWRDTSDENIQYIKNLINKPIGDLVDELREGYFWCDEWGEKPDKLESAEQLLLCNYRQAPPLIPIYSHRYIPFSDNNSDIPVFSIMGSDIIYYGENLVAYLEIEFGFRKHNEIVQSKCQYVKFWSDLI